MNQSVIDRRRKPSLAQRCGIAVDRCQHSALAKIVESLPKQQRTSLWKLYRWYCTKIEQSGHNAVSPSVEEIHAGTALSRQAICDARPRLEKMGLLKTHRIKGKGGFCEVVLLNAGNGRELNWDTKPMPSYFQSPRFLTHRKIYRDLHGTAVLMYDVMAANFNRTGGKSFTRAKLSQIGKVSMPTVREALERLEAVKLIDCGEDVELLHPETGEPMTDSAAEEHPEQPLRYYDPTTCQRKRLKFTPELYEDYYRHSLPHSDLWNVGGNAHCPFHDDTEPSLSINVEIGVWHCHACGDGGGIVDFEMRLTEVDDKREAWQRIAKKLDIRVCPPSRGAITHRHPYRNEDGDVLYWLYRYENGSARFMHKINGKLRPGLGSSRRTLYNLPEILRANTVIITEGEKKADVVHSLGLLDERAQPVAVSATGSANSWKIDYADHLLAKRVIVLADSDSPGQKYANAIKGSLKRLGIPCITISFGDYGKDVRDFLRNRSAADLIELIDCSWLMKASHFKVHQKSPPVILPGMESYNIPEEGEISL